MCPELAGTAPLSKMLQAGGGLRSRVMELNPPRPVPSSRPRPQTACDSVYFADAGQTQISGSHLLSRIPGSSQESLGFPDLCAATRLGSLRVCLMSPLMPVALFPGFKASLSAKQEGMCDSGLQVAESQLRAEAALGCTEPTAGGPLLPEMHICPIASLPP